MKQFQYTNRSLVTYGPFDLAAAAPRTANSRALDALAVGSTWIDDDGDTWERLPDVLDPAAATDALTRAGVIVDTPKCDERLERIATAVLSGLLASPNTGRATGYRSLAEEAVTTAKALIAELDKQS